MFSIANFLDSVKATSSIDSDYRLAKVIGKSHWPITNYRTGRTLPNEEVIEQLCALSGDDPDLIAAQVQAARAKDAPARDLWTRIAARLESYRRLGFLALVGLVLNRPPAVLAGVTVKDRHTVHGVDFLGLVFMPIGLLSSF